MYKKIIFFILVFFWISLSVFNVFYNSTKTLSEIREWGPLSEDQKRLKLFGASHEFSVFINAHTTPNTKILFYSETGMPYFYARYYSYPRHLYWYQNNSEYVKSKYPEHFDYVALYNMHPSIKDYEYVASFSAKYSSVTGYLYKRK